MRRLVICFFTICKGSSLSHTLSALIRMVSYLLESQSAAAGEMVVTVEGDYFGVDAQGNKVKLSLATLEKKYLDACNVSLTFLMVDAPAGLATMHAICALPPF